MARKLLVVVDTQYDFMMKNGALPVPRAEEIVCFLNKYVVKCAKDDDFAGILFTFDTHDESQYAESAEAQQFPIHCVRGTPGWENVINPALAVDKAWVLHKDVFDMWEKNVDVFNYNNTTNTYALDQFVEMLKLSGITEIEVAGVAADFCVKYAIRGFLDNGFKVFAMADLTAGIERNMVQVIFDEFPNDLVRMRTGLV